MNTEYFMKMAIKEAKKAEKIGEVPVGAVIVKDGIVIGRGYNKRESKQQAIAHAEIIAIKNACSKLKTWRLSECDIYVTLEPCPMCAGALIQARIRRLYFGAYDDKSGSVVSVNNILDTGLYNHHVTYKGGILQDECKDLLSSFFKTLRNKKSGRQPT